MDSLRNDCQIHTEGEGLLLCHLATLLVLAK